MILAAVVGGGAVYLWHRRLLQRGMLGVEDYTSTGLGSLDVGEQVSVSQWGADGTTHVHYRGSEWKARYHGAHVPAVAGTSSRKTYGEGLLSRKKQNDLSCVFEMYEQMQIW